mgnify:FL=1
MRLSAIDSYSMYLFHNGTNGNSCRLLGAHRTVWRRKPCVRFPSGSPCPKGQCGGDFNHWDPEANPMERAEDGEIWKTFVPDLPEGTLYKYAIITASGETILKADPYGFRAQLRPDTASVVASLNYRWRDGAWQKSRAKYDSYHGP